MRDEPMFAIQRHSPVSFLARAEPWLLRNEAEHNLVLGLAYRLQHSDAGFDAPIYLATIEQGGDVAGCVFRTPPHKLGLTRMPLEAVSHVIADVADVYDALPAVLGPEAETRVFTQLWSEQRGVHARQAQRNRIYQLDRVIMPAQMPSGRMRQATKGDAPLVASWIDAFTAEAHALLSGDVAERRIAEGTIFLWDDDGVRSMAGVAAETLHGARIGYVYSPAAYRGRGYASALTAALSARMLEHGKRFCFLYTDLANPTSNSIYQKIGYRAVCDVGDWTFE